IHPLQSVGKAISRVAADATVAFPSRPSAQFREINVSPDRLESPPSTEAAANNTVFAAGTAGDRLSLQAPSLRSLVTRNAVLLRSRPSVGWRCRHCRLRAIVLDLNLRAPDAVAHGLGALVAFAAHDHLPLQPRLLTDDWLLAMGGHVNRAILEDL